MSEVISHEGQVVSISLSDVRVRITQTSACAACHAKGSCTAADATEKLVDCVTDDNLHVGDTVRVEVAQQTGWLAVLLAFVLPFLIMFVVLVVLQRVLSEELAGTLALCSLLPYYGVLALFRNKLKRKFVFKAVRM